MKIAIVAIRDIFADCYMAPNYAHTIGSAVRDFHDLCKNKEHPVGKHPEHYELYHMGWWLDGDGTFEIMHTKRQLATGLDNETNV